MTKAIALKKERGNPQPRIIKASVGLLSLAGLANQGIGKFIRNSLPTLPKYLKFGLPVIVLVLVGFQVVKMP